MSRQSVEQSPDQSFFSQYGEDKRLAEIFQRNGGVCVEVGPYDGRKYSNTLYFERAGWTCILIEPNPRLCEQIRRSRTGPLFEVAASARPGRLTISIADNVDELSAIAPSPEHAARVAREGGTLRPIEVEARTLDAILEESGVPSVDFITIDVEGWEPSVLQGFDVARWRPRVLIVEENSGVSRHEVVSYLSAHGYRKFERTGCNDWYTNDQELCKWQRMATVWTSDQIRRFKVTLRQLFSRAKDAST